MVALDAAGSPSFQRLQSRAQADAGRSTSAARPSRTPVTFFAFDLLAFEDLRSPAAPAAASEGAAPAGAPADGDRCATSTTSSDDGEALYEQVQALGLEGIMAKRADSPYKRGPLRAWLKIRTRRTGRLRRGRLHRAQGHARRVSGRCISAQYDDGELIYTGRVGTGFTDKQLAEATRKQLEPQGRETPPCAGPVPKEKGTTWVEPALVCEVEYTELTDEGLLRHPVFLRFRDDKKPRSVCARARGSGGRRREPTR